MNKKMIIKKYILIVLIIIVALFITDIFADISGADLARKKKRRNTVIVPNTANIIKNLNEKRLFEFSPQDVDNYLKFLHQTEPDARKRIGHLANKCLGQPYDLYLLGEYPFELFDSQPMYSLDKSDCVVFAEHMYAMALSKNWKSFITMLQRIRYKDGNIGILSRNHFTEYDWVINNSWLIHDITKEIEGITPYEVTTKVNKAAFFKKWNIGQDIPVSEVTWSYIPADQIKQVLPYLKTGDFVNLVRGYSPDKVMVTHVGIISVDKNGTVNLVHSTNPAVRSEPIIEYPNPKYQEMNQDDITNSSDEQDIEYNYQDPSSSSSDNFSSDETDGYTTYYYKRKRKQRAVKSFYGFRFLRLNENALDNLKKIDGPNAPKLTIYGNQ